MTGRSFVLATALCAVASLMSATGAWAQKSPPKNIPSTSAAPAPGGYAPGAHTGGGQPMGHGTHFQPRSPFGFGGVVIQPSYAEPYEPISRIHRPRSHILAHRPQPRSVAHAPAGAGTRLKGIAATLAPTALNVPEPGKINPNISRLPSSQATPVGGSLPRPTVMLKIGATMATVEAPEADQVDCLDCGAPAEDDCTWVNRTLWAPQGEIVRRVRYCAVKGQL